VKGALLAQHAACQEPRGASVAGRPHGTTGLREQAGPVSSLHSRFGRGREVWAWAMLGVFGALLAFSRVLRAQHALFTCYTCACSRV